MYTKNCIKCNQEKILEDFVKRNDCLDGRKNICKKCDNKHRLDKRTKKYNVIGHDDNHKICTSCNIEKHIDEFPLSIKGKLGRDSRCKKCKMDKYHTTKDLEIARKKQKQYRDVNKDKINKRKREYYQNNKEKVKKYFREYNKGRKLNINQKIAKNLRNRLRDTLQGVRKAKKTLELLDCSLDEFKRHIEAHFIEGMSWDNYGNGGWEIDHIKPCASFDLSNPKHQCECFHWTNLQPMWKPDNQSKGSLWIGKRWKNNTMSK